MKRSFVKKSRPLKAIRSRRRVKRTQHGHGSPGTSNSAALLAASSAAARANQRRRLLLTNTNVVQAQAELTGTDAFGDEIQLNGNEVLPQDNLPFSSNPTLPPDGLLGQPNGQGGSLAPSTSQH